MRVLFFLSNDSQDAFPDMVCELPVTADGDVAGRAARSRFSAKLERGLYKRSIKTQMKLI